MNSDKNKLPPIKDDAVDKYLAQITNVFSNNTAKILDEHDDHELIMLTYLYIEDSIKRFEQAGISEHQALILMIQFTVARLYQKRTNNLPPSVEKMVMAHNERYAH